MKRLIRTVEEERLWQHYVKIREDEARVLQGIQNHAAHAETPIPMLFADGGVSEPIREI